MTTITQKIPNLLGGISQQPDVKKFPGEVRKCINAFPEYALGLMKRPGSKVEALLRGAALPGGSAATPSGQSAVTRYYGATEKWFDINVDGVPYVGQINDYHYGLQGTIVGGSGYTDEIYNNVPLTGGTGSGATANITVSGNAVTVVEIVNHGTGYATGDVLSADDSNLGGGGGSNFTFTLTRGSTDHLSLQLWFKDSGIPRAVNLDNYMEANYISSGSWSNYQTQINAEAGAIVAKIGGLSTFQAEQKTYYANYQNTIDNLDNIFRVDTTYNKGEVYQFIFNGVLQDDNDNISFITDGDVMTGSMPTTQATGDVILKSSTLTNLSLTAAGTGYQNSAELTFNGSGSNAAGTLTLAERGTFAGIDITNPGEGYSHEPIVNLTGDLAAICHPKCTMTGPWDQRYATADEPTKVVDIQLNPGKEIDLTQMVASQSEDGTNAYYIDDNFGYGNHTLLSAAEIAEAEVFHNYGTAYAGSYFYRKEISGTGHEYSSRWYTTTGENVKLPAPYLYYNSTSTFGDSPNIFIKPQDLTNVHTIRVYGITGGYDPATLDSNGLDSDVNQDSGQSNNGLKPPTFKDSSSWPYTTLKTQDPHWCVLEFHDLSTEQPNYPYDGNGEINLRLPDRNRNNQYLLRECQRPALNYGSVAYQNGNHFVVTDYSAMNFPRDFLPEGVSEFPEDADDILPLTIPAHVLDERDFRYGYTDVVVPAEFRKNGVAFRLNVGNSKSFAFTTMHLLTDLPAQINDCTITLTKNTIQTKDDSISGHNDSQIEDEPDPTTAATARVLINKAIVSADLTAAGTGYQDGQQTTTTVTAPSVDSFNITNVGEDYESVPAINITGGGGTGATATAVLSNRGRFKRFNITNGGSGYTSAPTVTLGGTLVGRTATATITGDAVTSITLDANTLDVNAAASWLTAVNPNTNFGWPHRPKVGVTINAQNGNGTPRRNIDTDNIDPSGTGFAIGNHLLFDGSNPSLNGNPAYGNKKRWIISKPINTTLSERLRVRAICGTDSSTDGSQNGGYMKRYQYRTEEEGYTGVAFAEHNTNRMTLSSRDAIRVYFHIGSATTSSFDFCDDNSSGEPNISNWSPLEIEAVPLTNRARSGTSLTDYYVDLPELARGEHIVFMFAQDADNSANPTDGSINHSYLNTSEIGITQIEFEDTDDYVIADSVASGATVTFSGGGGTDAAASVVLGKKLDRITSTDAGSGFTGSPSIAFTGGNPTTPAAASTLFFGSGATVGTAFTQIFEGDITDPGLGYLSATGTISGGGGSGATADISVLDGKVSHIAVTGGNGLYISNPTLAISAPNLAGGTSFPRFASNDEFDEFVEQGTGDVYKIGIERTDDYPILIDAYPKGYRLWEILSLDRASDPDGTALRAYETSTYDPAEVVYDGLVSAHNTAITNTDNAYPTFDITKLPINGASNYFVDDVAGGGAKVDLSKLKVVTFQDTTFILNPNKKVEYSTDKTPVAKFDEGFIFFKVLSNGDFEVDITLLSNDPSGKEPHEVGYIRTVDTSFGTNGTLTGSSTHNSSTNTVEEHLTDLDTSFTNGYANFGNDFDFIQSGNGIYIATKGALANRQFELVVSGPTEDSIDTLRHEINDISQLPIQLKEGYKVKIVNSLQANADDFYVTFRTEESGNDYSGGTWEESNGRDIPYKIDPNTMPHALTVNSDGSFSFGPWTHWDERQVGDELTNPTPEFITTTGANRYIKDMFVYRNRLGFLSQDYVSLSRAGEFFNFFTKSAIAGADDDPINISVSDVDTPNLAYVSKEAAGLLIFGDTGQYLLSTDSDVLAPTTAKINKVSGFKSDIDNPSLSLGGTTAFVSKTVSSTKMFELLKVSSIQPPDVIEQSRTVPELLPTSVDSIVGSPDLGLVSFGTIGTTTLYHFNYLRVGDREIGSAWYQWELPGNLLHQFFDTNEYHAVIRTATNETLTVSFDVAQTSVAGVLSLDSGKKTDLVLDVYDDKPLITYTGINAQGILEDKTKIYLPTGKLNDKDLVVVMYSNRSQVFDEETITMTEQTDATHGNYIEVDGDWRGSDVFVGYKYNMSVELPRFYFKRVQNEQINTDVDADLIIHKLKVKTGLTGPITYKVEIVGIPDRTATYTITPSGQYNLDAVNMTETGTHVVPVYQRNDNTIVTVESNTAFPATIESINWEGRYATNFYRRA